MRGSKTSQRIYISCKKGKKKKKKKKKEFWNLGLISKANRIELKKAESDTKSI